MTGPIYPAFWFFVTRPIYSDTRKFSGEKAAAFETKYTEVKKLENIDRAVGFIFSRCGFTKEAEAYCKEKGIACSEDERWLETGKLKPPVV